MVHPSESCVRSSAPGFRVKGPFTLTLNPERRREEIQSPACAARVQKIMEYASSDIRFDVPLAEACFEDRQEFCSSVPPGSARVIRCLQDRRARSRMLLPWCLHEGFPHA